MPPKRHVQDEGEEDVEDITLPEYGDVSELLKEMNIPDGTGLCTGLCVLDQNPF